jgi:hypothetical protein
MSIGFGVLVYRPRSYAFFLIIPPALMYIYSFPSEFDHYFFSLQDSES